jgi:DNA-binding transcriptional LysR family regulator
MLLRRHNLNLLPVLRELLRTQSVSRTARNVGLTQPAVSAALARLREDFGDPLLVMVGRQLVRTEKGEQLIEPVERACIEMEALLQPAQFVPDRETRRFVVATADYVSYLLAPALTMILGQEAPNASVHFIDYGNNLEERLGRGDIDIVALPDDTAGRLRAKFCSGPLFVDETVIIAAIGNPHLAGGLTQDIFEASPHAMFELSPKGNTSHEARLLARGGIHHKDRILVSQFLALPEIVERTDCLALVQRRLALRYLRSHAIAIHDPPFDVGPLRIDAFWSRSSGRDPAHSWFRQALARAAAALDASPR